MMKNKNSDKDVYDIQDAEKLYAQYIKKFGELHGNSGNNVYDADDASKLYAAESANVEDAVNSKKSKHLVFNIEAGKEIYEPWIARFSELIRKKVEQRAYTVYVKDPISTGKKAATVGLRYPWGMESGIKLYDETVKNTAAILSLDQHNTGDEAVAKVLNKFDEYIKNKINGRLYSYYHGMYDPSNPASTSVDATANATLDSIVSSNDIYGNLMTKMNGVHFRNGMIDNLSNYVKEKLDKVGIYNDAFTVYDIINGEGPDSIKRYGLDIESSKGIEAKDLLQVGIKMIRKQRTKHSDNYSPGPSAVTLKDILRETIHGLTLDSRKTADTSGKTWGHFYDDQNMFAMSDVGIVSITELNLFAGLGRDIVASLAAWLAGPYTYLETGTLGKNAGALVNWFFTIGREFHRNPAKFGKFLLNSTLLKMQNPHLYNVDEYYETTASSLGAVASFFGLQFEKPYSGRTVRLGPSLLSWLPGAGSISGGTFVGKGTVANILNPLSAGAFLLFGEGVVPSALDTTVRMGGMDGSVTQVTITPADFMFPFGESIAEKIAQVENPAHMNSDVRDQMKGDWRVIDKGGSIIKLKKRGEKSKIYKADITNNFLVKVGSLYDVNHKSVYTDYGKDDIAVDDIKFIESRLSSVYMPFWFEDLRTGEIISFEAFFEGLTTSFAPQWSGVRPAGRVEQIHTYEGTDRSISLSFWAVSVNLGSFQIMYEKLNKLVTMVYPQFGELISYQPDGGTAKQIPFSAIPNAAPIIRMRIGDIIKTNYDSDRLEYILGKDDANSKYLEETNKAFFSDLVYEGKGIAGFITDLQFDMGQSTWETMQNFKAPIFMKVQFSFTVIHDIAPGLAPDGTNRAPVFPVGKYANKS